MVRTLDVQVNESESIGLDLDDLDVDPEDVLDLLSDSQLCPVAVWVKISAEYWKQGYLDQAEKIAQTAISHFQELNDSASLAPIYSLLANFQLARARLAPKLILLDARSDIMTGMPDKDKYHKDAAISYNLGEKAATESGGSNSFELAGELTRGLYELSTRALNEALKTFEGVLRKFPSNIVALMGKARILYTRRDFRGALKVFQSILKYKPDARPDPRIGIGSCFWALQQPQQARAAWERSLEVNPGNWSAQLLLGLESINRSKDSSQPDEERAASYRAGIHLIEQVFKANKSSASATNALSEFFIRKGALGKALKLAERTIQFADTIAVLSDGHLRAARVAHAEGLYEEAMKHYSFTSGDSAVNVLSAVGLAQMQIQADEIPAAIHTLDKLLQPKRDPPLEAIIMLASLRAYPRPALSSADTEQERQRAKELYERVVKLLDAPSSNLQDAKIPRNLGDDFDMYIEIARLWQSDNFDRATKALSDAIRIRTAAGGTAPPRVLNNLGVIKHMEGDVSGARELYEQAVPHAMALDTDEGEAAATSILYNLARAYEDQGESSLAREAYGRLLARHPEYIDAKARLAIMRMDELRWDEASNLIKQALTSNEKNSNIRALYIYYLTLPHFFNGNPHSLKFAKVFTFNVLKEDPHDVYALCAAGRLIYHDARENRDPSPAGAAQRMENFVKAANIYIKALSIDPQCAIAAQGLAIVIAEDVLGSWAPGQAVDDGMHKARYAQNARQALDIFAKVRESLNDESVYINMGHCHFVREEHDKAIESYDTAHKRFYQKPNVSVILFLARTWFSKANKTESIAAMRKALHYAQMALHLLPNDKAVLYNIAMIEQKAGEMMFALKPEKRTLVDLQWAIDHATHAQKLFAALAQDSSKPLPYNQDMAQQRFKYGETMLRKSTEHLAVQTQHENELKAKLEGARRQRQEEKERLDVIQREKLEEDRVRAEALAERRRQNRAEAEVWAEKTKMESDEEEEKKVRRTAAKKAKAAEPAGSGDEGKKKRRPRRKKSASVESDEEAGLFTEEEAATKQKKARPKKRIVDEDDEPQAAPTAPASKRRKTFKSKETISDSDEE